MRSKGQSAARRIAVVNHGYRVASKLRSTTTVDVAVAENGRVETLSLEAARHHGLTGQRLHSDAPWDDGERRLVLQGTHAGQCGKLRKHIRRIKVKLRRRPDDVVLLDLLAKAIDQFTYHAELVYLSAPATDKDSGAFGFTKAYLYNK